MSTPDGLRVEHLSVDRGGRPILRDVSLRVAPGEMVVIEGESGAGKTTLLRAIAGLLPYDGRVSARVRPAMVFQAHALAGRLSAEANVLVGTLGRIGLARATMRLWPAAERALVRDCLARVGLDGRSRADHLSGGQRQRVAIARALAQRAPVLLADEPVASLDPVNADAVLTLLRDLARQQGLAVLLCLHQPELAQRCADRRFRLRQGALLAIEARCDHPPSV